MNDISSPDQHNVSNNSFISNTASKEDDRANNIIHSYETYRTWAMCSLDYVKNELLSLCFPLFVHCYIELIRLSPNLKNNQPQEFWQKYFRQFLESYSEEISSLSLLATPEQLQQDSILSNNFLNCVVHNKFTVRITSTAFSLLQSFLEHEEVRQFISIINQYIGFNRLPDGAGSSLMERLAELDGYSISNINQNVENIPKISLGVYGISNNASSNRNPYSLPDMKNDSLHKEWMTKIVRPSYILDKQQEEMKSKKRKNNINNVNDNNNSSNGNNNSNNNNITSTGNSSQPSIIFATITNSYDDLLCMHINNNVSQVATGYKDSCIRVWRLDGENWLAKSVSNNSISNKGWMMDEVLPKTKYQIQKSSENNHNNNCYNDHSSSSFYDSNSNINNYHNSNSKTFRIDLHGHSRAVYGICQDLSNRLVVSSSLDETIRLWDVTISHCVAKYHTLSMAWAVSFAPIGYYFSSANQDATVALYGTDRVSPLRLMVGHTSDVNCVTWHPNSTLIASGSDDKTCRLWDIRSGNSARLYKGCTSPISSVAISPLGNLIAAGTDNGKIFIWDIDSQQQLSILQSHTAAVHSLCFSHDNHCLSSGGSDCSIKIWDIQTIFDQKSNKQTNTSAISNTINVKYPQHISVSSNPLQTFHTKFSSIYYMNYTSQHMLFAGGPFNMLSSNMSVKTEGNEKGTF
eukprot:gene14508-19478_t